MKICKKCSLEKDISCFSNYAAAKDGKRPWCRECMNAHNRAYMKTPRGKEVHKATNARYYASEKGQEYRKIEQDRWRSHRKVKNKIKRKIFRKTDEGRLKGRLAKREYYKRSKEKCLARSKVHYALKTGKLIRPDICSICNRISKVQGHHNDYSKPLDVIWMCCECHNNLHNPKIYE